MSILGIGGIYEGFQKIAEVDVIANSTIVDLSGLDGDLDKIYLLVLLIKDASGYPQVVLLYPNALTTNLSCQMLRADGTTVSAGRDTIHIRLGDIDVGYAQGFFSSIIYAESGVQRRTFTPNSYRGGTAINWLAYAGLWNDTTTKITSLRLESSRTNGIGAGSKIILYRKKG